MDAILWMFVSMLHCSRCYCHNHGCRIRPGYSMALVYHRYQWTLVVLQFCKA